MLSVHENTELQGEKSEKNRHKDSPEVSSVSWECYLQLADSSQSILQLVSIKLSAAGTPPFGNTPRLPKGQFMGLELLWDKQEP